MPRLPPAAIGSVVLLALGLRVGLVLSRGEALSADPDAYRTLAAGLARGEGIVDPVTRAPTAFRPPLYPLLLAGVEFLGGGPRATGLVQAILGTITVALTWHLGGRLGLGPRRAVAAAALVAIEPLLLLYTTHVMTETLAACLTVASFVAMLPPGFATCGTKCRFGAGQGFAAGLLWGAATLCRPELALCGLCAVASVAWSATATCRRKEGEVNATDSPRSTSRSLRGVLAASGGFCLMLVPWVVRNANVLDSPIATTTHGGYTLLLGNNDVFHDEVVAAPWGTVWSGESLRAWQREIEAEMARAEPPVHGEVARDAWQRRRATDWIAAHPGRFAEAAWLRVRRFWNPVPLGPGGASVGPVVRGAVGLFESLFLLFGLAGVLRGLSDRRTRGRWLAPALCAAALTCVHAVYWSNARMRAPLVPLIAVAAVAATLRGSGGTGVPQPGCGGTRA